jgi:toxin HigB-1
MIRSFRHKGLARFFETGDASGIRPDHARKLRLILGRLHAAAQPGDVDLPGLRLHELAGNRAGTWAANVSGNWRVTFRFSGDDAEAVNYEDYH